MKFYKDQLFHIYNQGNNSQTIFFNSHNYIFFLWKMRTYLLPYGDIIAYCLMPTHFHWLFFVRRIDIKRKVLREHIDKIENQRRTLKFGGNATQVNLNTKRYADENSIISLNESIGHLQKAYTRAINKEKGWSGSLFRKNCKAKDGWIDEFVTLKKLNGKDDFRFMPGSDYAYRCFNYIHDNPVEANLVENKNDWAYSSSRDYSEFRKGTLCNLRFGREIIKYI